MYDDVPLVVGNALLRDGHGLWTLLTHARMTSAPIWPGHYRPLLMLTYWLQYQWIGTAPWSYRLLNLLVHLADGLLIFVVARRLLRDERVAAAGAALWLAHPLNAIAVELVLKRNSSLCALFVLLALLAFLRGRDLAGIIAAAAALLVKEDAVVLPALLALVAVADARRVPWRRIAAYCVFPLGMAIWAVLRHRPGGAALAYLAAQPIAVARYLAMLLDPGAIAVAYDLEPGVTPLRLVVLALAVAMLPAAWLVRRRAPRVAFAIAWAAVALLPSSSLVPIAPAMDEIRVYLAFAPLFMLLAAQLMRVRYAAAIALVLVIVCARLTFDAALLWRDSPSLWAHAVARHPASRIGNRGLCEARPEPAQCRRAVALWPEDEFTRYDLVAALARAGDLPSARREAERAVADLPRAPMAWLALGHAAWLADDAATAERAYRQTLALAPDDDSARIHLADVVVTRDRDAAESLIRPLLRVRPADPSDAALLDSLREKLR